MTKRSVLIGCGLLTLLLLAAVAQATYLQSPASLRPASGKAPQADSDEQQVQAINRALDYFASALAARMPNREMRGFLWDEVAKRSRSDHQVLLSEIAGKELESGLRLSQHVAMGAAWRRLGKGFRLGLEQEQGMTDSYLASLAGLQLSVPVRFEEWDPKQHLPLVAVNPVGIDDMDLVEVKAYDSQGVVHWLNAWQEPDFPVIVIGLSEQLDRMGNRRIQPRGLPPECEEQPVETCEEETGSGSTGGPTCPAPGAAHSYGDAEILWTLEIFNDHEPWPNGSPEIYVRWNNPVSGIISNRAFPNVDDENKLYTLNSNLFTWNSPSSSGFTLEIYEDDGGLFGGGDDFLGSKLVNFSDPNCKLYGTGDAEFRMRFE